MTDEVGDAGLEDRETPAPETGAEETAEPEDSDSVAVVAPAPRPRRRRGSEVRIGFPGWAPFAFVAVFALGVVLGTVLTLVIEDDDPAPAAAAAPSTSVAGVSGGSSPAPAAPVEGDDARAYGAVEISGTPLPRLSDSGSGDPAVGMPAPGLSGADFAGNPVSIGADGQAKIIVFLAHWCPYCRQEVPEVRDWAAGFDFPASVGLYSVSTLTDPARPNYPPATWFEMEGWSIPLIVDDAAESAAGAFGLNAVPFWVLVNADNTIAGRGAGAVPVEVLEQIVTQLASGA